MPVEGRIRLLHLITTLDTGGAEMMLCRLLSRLDTRHFECRVISLMPPGPLAEGLVEANIAVTGLGMAKGRAELAALIKLLRLLRAWPPHVVQSWLYQADLLGLVASRCSGRSKLIWNIRGSHRPSALYSPLTRMLLKVLAPLSPFPDRIIFNSRAGCAYHRSLGYRTTQAVVIPNGLDLNQFRPDKQAALNLRNRLGLPADALLVGTVGRFHPAKDYPTLLEAAGRVLDRLPNVHFILCGDGVTTENRQIRSWRRLHPQSRNLHALGRWSKPETLMPGLDLLVSSSCSEGFPNVIAEAMACAVPCVATDVGDSARIVGDCGTCIPAARPDQLASAILRMLGLSLTERQRLGKAARRRIQARYDLDTVCATYAQLYREVLDPVG
jgi:glycosyltransferase involved in cell wall biosynthesis